MTQHLPPPELPGYRYLRPIPGGSGGFAQVYVYEQESLKREVAVKVLTAVGDTDERDVGAEGMRMAKLGSHSNVAQVIEILKAKDGRPCIVMMYYRGRNLMQIVEAGVLDVRRVVRLGIQLADALQTAHDEGVIHRDVKPANILTDERGVPRLTDFGIAALVGPGGDGDAGPSAVSLFWCPPELLDNDRGTVAADIFSLGATLWHLLAGTPWLGVPAPADTRERIENLIRHVAPSPTGRSDVPPSLEWLLARMLAKHPAERPASAADIKLALTGIERELGGPVADGPLWYPAVAPTFVTTAPSAIGSVPLGDLARTSLRTPTPARVPVPSSPGPMSAVSVPAVTALTARPPGRETELRPRPVEEEPRPPEPPPPGRGARWLWAVAGVLVLTATVGVLVAVRPWAPSGPAPSGLAPSSEVLDGDDANPFDDLPPGPPTVTVKRVGGQNVQATWEYSNPLDSDTYAWQSDTGLSGEVDDPVVELTVAEGVRVCVQVRVYRYDGSFASPTWSEPGCGGEE